MFKAHATVIAQPRPACYPLHMLVLLQLVSGTLLLYAGAECLVRGGAALALRIGVTPLVVGLTIVAFGTSSPELVVSFNAARHHDTAIVLGNVIGSNIANLALVLGLAALLRPLSVERQVIRREVPIMTALTILLGFFLWNGTLGRLEGALLVLILIFYTWFSIYLSRKEQVEAPKLATLSASAGTALVVVGALLLAPGATLFVTGAVSVATWFGLSPFVIGLTVVAIGTSLPEIATSLIAAAKGEGDLAVGNAVGSNVFNILFILGISALFFVIDGAEVHPIDWFMLLGVAVIMLPIMRTGFIISRLEGALLVTGYAVYIGWLVIRGG